MTNLSWEQYFLALAQITSLRSKDPNTKVGAILVNSSNRVIATGYNGMPKGDDTFPWSRSEKENELTKYPYVIHAEMNAILNSIEKVEGARAYVTLFPCSECAKLMAHCGIQEIIFIDDKYKDTENTKIAKKTLTKCDVKFRKGNSIKVNLEY